mmetsp:Transcript_23993/g.33677  ORF Transcript_23993/g.33677 Transcript_23993/m.33677 type:complete len:169 (-) Transcript_23993:368-874(-)
MIWMTKMTIMSFVDDFYGRDFCCIFMLRTNRNTSYFLLTLLALNCSLYCVLSRPSLCGTFHLAFQNQTRHDVVSEVMKAPKRRIDNTNTHLNDSVHLLLMHTSIVDDVRRRYSQRLWEHRIQEGGSLLTGSTLIALSVHTSLPVLFTGRVLAATVLGIGGLDCLIPKK